MPTRNMTVRQSLILSSVILILLVSGTILVVAAVGALRGARELARTAIAETGDAVERELGDFFGEVERDVRVAARWVRANGLGPDDPESLTALFQPMIEENPHLSSIMVADSRGAEFMILQDPLDHAEWLVRLVPPAGADGGVVMRRWNTMTGRTEQSVETLEYDTRSRVYYQVALAGDPLGGVAWTAPTVFFTTRDPGVTAGTHFTAGGSPERTVVVAFDVLLLDVSRITTAQKIGDRGTAFVLSAPRGGVPQVIGLPSGSAYADEAGLRGALLAGGTEEADARPTLPRASDFPFDPLRFASLAWQSAGQDAIGFRVGDEDWWADFRPFRIGESSLWIGVAAPESDFLGSLLEQGRTVALIAILAMLLAAAAATRLARSYAHPLEALARTSTRIGTLDLSPPEPVESRLVEVQALAREQDQMRVALDAFARYVPVELVRRLLARGEAARIGGTRQVITILFTDIEGFTTIAEARDPEALTRHLTEYFEEMLEAIRAYHGEVNQLLGDGLMAYWGAPAVDPDHARHAVEAVLHCQARLTELNAGWRERDLPPLPTRFGLASGEVVVGNVGSPSRLAYVAVGDPANLASRIEGLNRFYGTRLLVAERTRALAGEGLAWRHVDGVRAKGKTVAVELYEPLGLVEQVPQERLSFRDTYERALMKYRARAFGEALRELDGVPPAWQVDLSVTRLRLLCDEALRSPPSTDWDAITEFHVK